jgi:hypothetical protein
MRTVWHNPKAWLGLDLDQSAGPYVIYIHLRAARLDPAEERPSMSDTATLERPVTAGTQHFDVLIVGAGISGIGGAYHLTTQSPGKSFVVLETQESFGGTWHTHRYPGIRSDSDLYTFGYRFKP